MVDLAVDGGIIISDSIFSHKKAQGFTRRFDNINAGWAKKGVVYADRSYGRKNESSDKR
jgi:hypothetical protein